MVLIDGISAYYFDKFHNLRLKIFVSVIIIYDVMSFLLEHLVIYLSDKHIWWDVFP